MTLPLFLIMSPSKKTFLLISKFPVFLNASKTIAVVVYTHNKRDITVIYDIFRVFELDQLLSPSLVPEHCLVDLAFLITTYRSTHLTPHIIGLNMQDLNFKHKKKLEKIWTELLELSVKNVIMESSLPFFYMQP